MSRYIWLTNTSSYALQRVVADLQAGHTPSRELIVNEPRATAEYSTYQLRKMGMVGIYEVKS